MRGFLKITGVIIALPVIAFCLWLGNLTWRSPDYARAGTCSAHEIGMTRAAIDAMHMHHDAAIIRGHHENGLFNQGRRTLRNTAERGFAMMAFKAWDKENSAAFFCSHAYIRPAGERPFLSLPPAVDWLKPHTRDDGEAWRLATCLSYSGYSPKFPEGYTTDVPALRTLCDRRASLRIKRVE